MSADPWPQEVSLQFIELYKRRPLLWDPDDEHYYNKMFKAQAWQQIADELDSTSDTCQRKMACLLSSFRRVRAKQRQERRKTGRTPRFVRWFAYDSLKFLLKRRNKDGTVDENVCDEPEPENVFSENESQDVTVETEDADLETVQIKLEPKRRNPLDLEFVNLKTKKRKIKGSEDVEYIQPVDSNPESNSDECFSFGTFVANKMKHYSWKTRCSVQHAISNILFKADQGTYEAAFVSRRDLENGDAD